MFKRSLPGTGVVPGLQTALPPRSTTPTLTLATQPDPLPSLDEINKRFTDAQEDRHKIFERARRQHRITFLEAITTRENGADRRDKEFAQLLNQIRLTYFANRTDRNNAFNVSEAKRDGFFDAQEKTRQALFEVAEQRRERAFQHIRDHHWQVAGELTQQRQALFAQGRSKRQHVYDEVEALFALFDTLMERETTAFFACQEQRDEDVTAAVNVSLLSVQSHTGASDT